MAETVKEVERERRGSVEGAERGTVPMGDHARLKSFSPFSRGCWLFFVGFAFDCAALSLPFSLGP